MNTLRNAVSLGVLSLGAALGCDVDAGGGGALVDEVTARGEVPNGQVLNSAVLNGIQFNGIQFNGIQFNGIQFNGSSFTGTLDGVVMTDVDFAGAEIAVTMGGSAFTLRFDDVYEDPARPGGDVYFYDVSVREDSVGTWSSLCKDVGGNPVAAIPVANYWNYTTGARVDDANVVTFACRGAAIAKCVEWGYIPWHTAVQCDSEGACAAISLKDHHQACTRMVRADYCGDGQSYTFNGTPIDLYDRLQTQVQASSTLGYTNWAPEAEWGPNGATCVGDELRMQMYDDLEVPYTYPVCLDAIDDLGDCGALPASRATSLVADAYCYMWTADPGECAGVPHDEEGET